jgi:hypothetical protein
MDNLYLVSNPVRVMRSSGTVIFVELSLGYDVPRHEIVSPNFMNTRNLDASERFIPDVEALTEAVGTGASTDALVFDKAEEAASVTKLREKLEAAQERIKVCRELADDKNKPDAADAAAAEIETLEKKIERLMALIDRKEAKISEE